MKTVEYMLVMDVDEVISNLQTKTITKPRILAFIAQRLELGEPVALNTGRGLEWTIDNVINLLAPQIKNKKN